MRTSRRLSLLPRESNVCSKAENAGRNAMSAPACHQHVPNGLRAKGIPDWELRCCSPERCAAERRCFWARFHQLEGMDEADSASADDGPAQAGFEF